MTRTYGPMSALRRCLTQSSLFVGLLAVLLVNPTGASQGTISPYTYRGIRAGMPSAEALRILRRAATLGDSVSCIRFKRAVQARFCTIDRGEFPPDGAELTVTVFLDESSQQVISAIFGREDPMDSDSTFNVWFLALQQRWGAPRELYDQYIATWTRGRFEAEWEHNVVVSGNDSLQVTLRDRVLADRFQARLNRFRAGNTEP